MGSEQILRALETLKAASGFEALRHAIAKLSENTGPVMAYSITFDSTTRTVCCFLEMRSPLHDSEVRQLGAIGFGNGLLIEFAVGPDFSKFTGTSAP